MAGGVAFGDELQHLALLEGQLAADIRPAVGVLVEEGFDHDGGDLGAEVGLTGEDGPHGRAHLAEGALLEQIAGRPCPQHADDKALVRMHGQGDHLDARQFGQELMGGVDPVHVGHADIHDDQIGRALLGQLHRRLAVGRLGHDLHIRLFLDEAPQALSDNLVIVGDQDAALHTASLCDKRASGAVRTRRDPLPGSDRITRRPPRW